MKKILGVFFLLMVVISLVGAITGGTYEDLTGPALLGKLLGNLISYAALAGGGIFLLTFDGIYQKPLSEGIQLRKKQNKWITAFAIFFGIMFALSAGNVGVQVSNVILDEQPTTLIIKAILSALPSLLWFAVFLSMYMIYAAGYRNCVKQFGYGPEFLNTYLWDLSQYRPVSQSGKVLASDKALYFKKLFCVIPYDQIESVKYVNQIVEKDIFFKLKNGKKILILSADYKGIMEAIESHK